LRQRINPRVREAMRQRGTLGGNALLLHGPAGVGKSTLVERAVKQTGLDLVRRDGRRPGGEDTDTGVFATLIGALKTPSERVILVEHADSLIGVTSGPHLPRNLQNQARLSTLIEHVNAASHLFLILETRRDPSELDPSTWRVADFLRLGLPDHRTRTEVLYDLLREPGFDVSAFALSVPGYTPAELRQLVHYADHLALSRRGALSLEDLTHARDARPPGVGRSGFAVTRPTVRLEDVGGHQLAAQRLLRLADHGNASGYDRLGAKRSRGALLSGIEGVGKTLLVQAVAGHLGRNLIVLRPGDVLSIFQGETAQRLRDAHQQAIDLEAMVFIDEADALVSRRDRFGPGELTDSRARISQILQAVDGVGRDDDDVFYVLASNLPGVIDRAMRRRISTITMEAPGNASERRQILEAQARRLRLAPDVDLGWLANASDQFTGSDLEELHSRAAANALARSRGAELMTRADYQVALEEVQFDVRSRLED
jgi:transitional endoplasmic reticulum ATPase